MGAGIAAGGMAANHRLIRRLREAGAISPDTAAELAPRSSVEKRRLKDLERRGVIRPAGADRFYLDEAELAEWRADRQRRVWLGLLIAMVVLAVLAFYLWSQRP